MQQFNILVDSSRSAHPTNLIDPNLSIINEITKFNDSNREFSEYLVVMESSLMKSGFLLSLKLVKHLYDLNIIFVTNKNDLIRVVSSIGEVLKADPLQLTYDLLTSFVNKDLASVEFLLDSSVGSESPEMNLEEKVEYLETVNSYLVEMLESKEREYQKLRDKVQLERENQKIIEGKYKMLLDKAIQNDIVLSQLEVAFTQDIYEIVDVNLYPNCPRILYIKEYQDIPHKYSFIRTLYDSIRLTLRKSVKVLALMDSTSSREPHYAPEYYERLYNMYTRVDLLTNDFILKIGDHREALDVILANSVGLDTLIILDMNSHAGSVVNKANLNLVLARDFEKTVNLGVHPGIIITSNPKDPKNWLHYPEYSEMSDEEKFIYLSSRPVIQNILKTWGVGHGIT